MQKVVIVVTIILIAFTGFLLLPFNNSDEQVNSTYLRVHIRANSNTQQDQDIKYEIKQLVIDYLTPKVKEASTFEEAKVILDNNLQDLSDLATDYLHKKEFAYDAVAKINTEYFPTRSYENATLESGYYDALILELGAAEGDNWWCVIYPPLCFSQSTDTSNIEYRSIIEELLKKREE